MRRVSCSIPALLLALMLSPCSGLAEIGARAQGVVDRYVEATGGRAALEAERRTHSVGRIESIQLTGTIEQWTQVPDKLVVRVRLGSLRLSTGTDGTTAWETDLAAKHVRQLEGHELEHARADAWFENEMWARAGQGGGRVEFVATSFRDGDEFTCLELTPPVGAARRMWFNNRTGLITRIIERVDQNDAVLFLSKYRQLGGRTRATLQDGVDQSFAFLSDETPTNRVMLDSLDAGGPGDSTIFQPPPSVERTVTWLKAHGLARVGFRYGSRHVWIKASINGLPPADFLLDTGAATTAIDRAYADQLGLLKEGRFDALGMGGNASASFARVGSIRITGPDGDGVQLSDFKVGVVDLGERHEEVLWRKMAGLIGYDVLGRFAVEIDYDRQVVTFHEPRTFTYRGAGTPLDMKLMAGIPIVRAVFDGGCGGDFLVDVGNSFGAIVHGSLSRRCRVFARVADRKQVKIYGGGVGDGFQSWLCRLDTLQIGPYTICQPILALSLATNGLVGSDDIAGNLGNGVLERFKVTIDFLRRKLYLEPGERFTERDRYSRIGAYLLRSQDRVVAQGVVHGSPADAAGLKDKDEVLEIDGRPAKDFTPEELDRMFVDGEVGATHTLKVLREYKPATLTLRLQDVI